MNIEKLKFPIGKYTSINNPDKKVINNWIDDIERFPSRIKELVTGIQDSQLNWRYRPKGWSVKQVIHHCADSHMNAFIRFKLALTEETPIIKPYREEKWANLADSLTIEIDESLMLLTGLHKKWARLIKSLSLDQLEMDYEHPQHGLKFNLISTIGMYSWHCNHHLEHIKNALKSKSY